MLDRIRDLYDLILIDCAPSLGLLTVNAPTASDKVIIPLECEFFALRGVALLTDTISKVIDRLNPDLLGAMPSKLLVPDDPALGPDPAHLAYHRTNVFGG